MALTPAPNYYANSARGRRDTTGDRDASADDINVGIAAEHHAADGCGCCCASQAL